MSVWLRGDAKRPGSLEEGRGATADVVGELLVYARARKRPSVSPCGEAVDVRVYVGVSV